MPRVYLLSEDDFDEQVYVYLLEALLPPARFDPIPIRLRRGGGLGEVRKKLPLLLSMIRRTGPVDDTCFVIGIDNDRAVEHPTHERRAHSREEGCRHCGLTDAIYAGMPNGWPIPGAVAVPVQMIEACLLLMHDIERYPQEATLPVCARRDQETARRLYGADPPPQLRDLVDSERERSSLPTKLDFALGCIVQLDPESLASRSPSFERFRIQVLSIGLV